MNWLLKTREDMSQLKWDICYSVLASCYMRIWVWVSFWNFHKKLKGGLFMWNPTFLKVGSWSDLSLIFVQKNNACLYIEYNLGIQFYFSVIHKYIMTIVTTVIIISFITNIIAFTFIIEFLWCGRVYASYFTYIISFNTHN